MLCPSCHKENRENAKFCKYCGYAFPAAQSAPIDVTNTASATATPTATAATTNSASPVNVVGADSTNTATSSEGQSTLQPAATNGTQAPQASQVQTEQQATGNEQPVEVVVQDAAPVDVQGADATPTHVDNDATQVLSHEEMLAIQARRQHQGMSEGQGGQQGGQEDQPPASTVGENSTPPPSLDQTPEGDMVAGEPAASVIQQSVMPQGVINQTPTEQTSTDQTPTEDSGNAPIPPPPPAESLQPGVTPPNTSPYAQEAATPPVSVTPVPEGEINQVSTQQQDVSSTDTDDASQGVINQTRTNQTRTNQTRTEQTPTEEGSVLPSPTDSSTLQVGAVVAGRYEVTDVLNPDEQAGQAQPVGRVYHVIDHQGYQRCWNCGSTQNAEGDEFCIECGAELLNAPYIMHEYPGDTTDNVNSETNEAHVLSGTIVNTFVENGRTYVIEQPQEAQIAFPNGVHLLVAGDSDAGTVRRAEPNEDSILVMELQRVHESHSSPSGVFIVADGMGGHANGQGASRLIINGIAQRMLNNLFLPPLNTEETGQEVKLREDADLVAILKDAVQQANNELCQQNQRDKSDAGSTLTGFMIVDDHAYIINVGDSRTYMLREGTLYQLTTDHSLVGQLVAGGLIEPDDVYTHPQRSQIFRSLGDKTNVQIDDFKQQLLPGDILLSCSDGLWEMVRNPQITDILINAHDPQTACTQLIEAANANGGEDNVSAIVVFVR